jgi:tRNA(Ile)-lysidine synthase
MHHEHFTTSDKKIDDFGVTVSSSDFPITIRNAKNGDKITMRYGTKKLSRFFIDRKIPYLDRLSWPVIENKDKQVIFVCELGCDKDHYSNNHNLYVTRKK